MTTNPKINPNITTEVEQLVSELNDLAASAYQLADSAQRLATKLRNDKADVQADKVVW